MNRNIKQQCINYWNESWLKGIEMVWVVEYELRFGKLD